MKINTMQKHYVFLLKDVFSAEKQIVKALPKMVKAAKSPELKAGFQKHLSESQQHVERLEQVFETLGMSGGRQKCKAMEAIISEAEEFMSSAEKNSDVMDLGLIATAQLVEHFEIASYGTILQYAQVMGDNRVMKILNKTLEEEKSTDQLLTTVAREILGRAVKAAKGSGSQPQQPSM